MHFAEFLEYIQAGHLAAVKDALQVNPDLIHLRDERDGVTALHWAAEYSQVEIAKWLIAHGADVHARDNEQATPLFSAAFKSLDIAFLLLEAGADIHARNEYGFTPLHELAWYGRLGESQFLLDHGANVQSRDTSGSTPLHRAADSGMAKEIALLVANGAEVDSRSTGGFTPLHCAVSANMMPHQLQWHLDTIETLLQHGADVNAQTNDLKTPLELAKISSRYSEIANLLIKYGAR